MVDIIPKTEMVFKDRGNVEAVVSALLQEDCVVMLSREDEFIVINFLYADNSDRNEVVFMSRDTFEDNFYEVEDWDYAYAYPNTCPNTGE